MISKSQLKANLIKTYSDTELGLLQALNFSCVESNVIVLKHFASACICHMKTWTFN